MADADVIPLAEGFAPATHDAWMRLVEKSLKGAEFETLRSRTADGIVVEPLYTAGESSPVRPAFSSDPARPWDVRALVTHPDPARAAGDVLHDLENGAASVLLSIDPTGPEGVAVGSRDELARALEGVVLDLAPVALDAGFLGPLATDWLADLAKGGPQAPLAFHLDPLGALARSGSSPGPIEAHVTLAAETAARHVPTYPKARLFLASGRAAHEAGGSEAQELAMALAAAVAYAEALQRAGLSLEDAFARITLGLSADGAYLTTIAKLRAARLLWAKATTACGVSAPAVIEARSSRRMLSRLDAWSNLLRLTSAAFGAALGGADAVVLEPFTAPLGPPTAFARRQARNIQLVLMEEAGLGRVSDPAGGAWGMEALTDQLARAAWTQFQEIQRQGGLAEALMSGRLAEQVGRVRGQRRSDLAEGRTGMIGVTMFPSREAPPAVDTVDPAGFAADAPEVRLPGADSMATALRPIRWSEPFEQDQEVA
ncbi:MAG TPA: methylmalonyl-CoA mutase family protein [Caulobacteraceae bacterium]